MEALGDEAREISAVIDVGVSEHDGCDAGRVGHGGVPVTFPQLAQTLEDAAVDEHAAPTGGEQELRTSDSSGATDELQRRCRVSHHARTSSRR